MSRRARVRVLFRMFTDADGTELVAVFPDEPADVACPASAEWKGVKGMPCLCDFYGSAHQTVPRIDVQEWRTRRRVEKLLAPHGVEAVFNGDPRGAVVKLKVPSGQTDDWGHVGICVPS